MKRSGLPAIVAASLLILTACAQSGTSSLDQTSAAGQSSTAGEPSASIPAAPPAISPDELEGTILFGRIGGEYGDATIFTMNADGSGDTRVGGYLADKQTCCPRWSPDGQHIAFPGMDGQGRFTTAITDRSGSNVQFLELPGTFQGACQIWSRGTSQLACDANYPGAASGGIYTVDARGSSAPQPVVVDVGIALPTDFSPDGSKIVFIGDPVGEPTGIDPGAPVGSLYVVNVDGSDLHRITPDSVYALYSSRWSPDGEWIVFAGLGRTGDPILAVHPDGSGLHEVFADPSRGAVHPTWSPDGAFIMFALDPPGTVATLSVSPPNEVCVIRADGSDLTCILDTPDHKIWFDWTAS